jgi:hypothetical protein
MEMPEGKCSTEGEHDGGPGWVQRESYEGDTQLSREQLATVQGKLAMLFKMWPLSHHLTHGELSASLMHWT